MWITLKDSPPNVAEAYVDDVVVTTKQQESLLRDLMNTFDCLRSTRLKPNPEKSVFGVLARKLLGFLISNRGIEVNP